MKKKLLILLVLILAVYTYNYNTEPKTDPLQPQIAKKILRFHILANSDSKEDQAIKLKVRDAVGTYVEPFLEDADSLEDTRTIINRNMEAIISVANQTLEANGKKYSATARITTIDFPEKTYGEYTFPPGEYEALQINLGEGDGHNWWCVLYPNMCFRGSVYEVISDDSRNELRKVLTTEEYQDVLGNGILDKGKICIRWKFLEYFGLTM